MSQIRKGRLLWGKTLNSGDPKARKTVGPLRCQAPRTHGDQIDPALPQGPQPGREYRPWAFHTNRETERILQRGHFRQGGQGGLLGGGGKVWEALYPRQREQKGPVAAVGVKKVRGDEGSGARAGEVLSEGERGTRVS